MHSYNMELGKPVKLTIVSEYCTEVENFRIKIDNQGMQTSSVCSATDIIKSLENQCINIILINIIGDARSGYVILRDIFCQFSVFPIIVRHDKFSSDDQFIFLSLGADVCVDISATIQDTSSKIRVLARRQMINGLTSNLPESDGVKRISVLIFAGWRMEREKMALYAPDGDLISLTSTEFKIMSSLVGEPERIFGRRDFVERNIFGPDQSDHRVLDVYMSRIRKKLAKHSDTSLIETVRGKGYRLVPPVTQE